jgi:sugar lactone lactonase YvrE
MNKVFIVFAALLLFLSASYAQWADYQAAEFVIGQPNLTTYNNGLSASGLAGPYSVAIDLQHSKLYVGDADNCRVLRYAYPLTSNQPTAELVFGQSNFTTDSAHIIFNATGSWPAPTAKQILYPMAMAVYNGDLWVLDENNERVVKFSQAYNQTINNPNADLVIGQATFTTRNYACTSSSFYTPWGMTIDGSGNLWVADAGNDRILLFNNASGLSNGASANGVLGQTNFTTGTFASTPTQSQFGLPSSLCFDGTTLWVSDRQFKRVLRFDNAAAKSAGASADGVLGQSDFTSNATGTTPTTFLQPFGVCADGKGNLYVSDQTNKRIEIFLNAKSKANGASADNVLGQTSLWNNASSYGSSSFAPGSVTNFAVDNSAGKLFVVDRVAQRVLQFTASGPLTGVEQDGRNNSSGVPQQFRLSSYPNPFNPSTTISFFIPYKSSVVVEVCDILGRTMKTLAHKEMSPGSYNLDFDGTSFASGVYYCRLSAGNILQTQKLILIK